MFRRVRQPDTQRVAVARQSSQLVEYCVRKVNQQALADAEITKLNTACRCCKNCKTPPEKSSKPSFYLATPAGL